VVKKKRALACKKSQQKENYAVKNGEAEKRLENLRKKKRGLGKKEGGVLWTTGGPPPNDLQGLGGNAGKLKGGHSGLLIQVTELNAPTEKNIQKQETKPRTEKLW